MKSHSRIAGNILQVDYDRVLSLSDEECCFSLTRKEVAMLLSQTDYFAWGTRWYSDIGTPIDTDVITTLKEQLEYKLMSGCCPDEGLLHRFSPEGIYQTSSDGGATWEDDPENDPRNDAIQSPPIPGEPGPSVRCAAADNIESLFTNYRDQLNDLLTASPTLVAIIAGILAFLAVITGISGAAIGISVLLMGLAAALLDLEEGEIITLINSTVLDTFKCLVYCRLEDNGQITYENWQLLLTDIAGEFDGFAELFFYQTVNGMGYIGLSNAGTIGVTSADDCGDCGCSNLCADKYEIFNGVPIGYPAGYFGTIVERDGDRIRVQFNSNYVYLVTITDFDCCNAYSFSVVSGGAAYSTAYNDCDTPFTGTNVQHETAWENHCVSMLQLQALGADRPLVDIFFNTEC